MKSVLLTVLLLVVSMSAEAAPDSLVSELESKQFALQSEWIGKEVDEIPSGYYVSSGSLGPGDVDDGPCYGVLIPTSDLVDAGAKNFLVRVDGNYVLGELLDGDGEMSLEFMNKNHGGISAVWLGPYDYRSPAGTVRSVISWEGKWSPVAIQAIEIEVSSDGGRDKLKQTVDLMKLIGEAVEERFAAVTPQDSDAPLWETGEAMDVLFFFDLDGRLLVDAIATNNPKRIPDGADSTFDVRLLGRYDFENKKFDILDSPPAARVKIEDFE